MDGLGIKGLDGWALLILGLHLAFWLVGNINPDFGKPQALFKHARDYLAAYAAVWVFFITGFAWVNDKNQNLVWAYCLALPIALLVAFGAAYILGTDELKRGIKAIPKGFKRKRKRKGWRTH